MPFSGSGTGIQNADDVFFSGLSDGETLQYDSGTAKWNNAAAVGGSGLQGYVNVKDYGATGDGSTDDSAAIKAAGDALIGSFSSGVSHRPTGVLYFPAGEYRVTQDNCLWPFGKDPRSGGWLKMRGLHIIGAGKHATTITFDSGIASQPTNLWEGNMMTALSNDPATHPTINGGATLQETVIEGLSFKSNNQYQRFFYGWCQDNRPQSDMKFRDCDWQGTWEYCFGLDGPVTLPNADQNSEISWYNCGTRDSTIFTDAFVHTGLTDDGALDQQVNYSMIDCSFEYHSGHLWNVVRGGSIRIWGGSFILGINDGSETDCAIFRLGNSSSGYGNNGTRSLQVFGTRFEMRHTNAKIIDSYWSSPLAKVTFIGTGQGDDGGHGDAEWEPFVFHAHPSYGIGQWRFEDCTLFGKIRVIGSGANLGGKMIFDGASFQNYPSGTSTSTTGVSLGTVTSEASNVLRNTAHGLTNGDVVSFTSGISGLTAGLKYTVTSASTDTFKVRDNIGSMYSPSISISAGGSATAARFGLIQHDGTEPSVKYRDCYIAADN